MKQGKKAIRTIIICLLALCFGYCFICALVLAGYYHDLHGALRYTIFGFLIMIVYGVLCLNLDQKLYKRNTEQGIKLEEESANQKSVKDQEQNCRIEKEEQDCSMKHMAYEQEMREDTFYKKRYVLAFLVEEAILLVITQKFLDPDSVIACMIIILLMAIVASVVVKKYRQRKDAFSLHFLEIGQSIVPEFASDKSCELLYHQLVKSRYHAATSLLMIYALACHLTLVCLQHRPMLTPIVIISFSLLGVLNHSRIIKEKDQLLVQALNTKQSTLVLAVLLRYYTQYHLILRPRFNLHTFIILALLQQEQYDHAYALYSMIKLPKSAKFQCYIQALGLLCQEGRKDRLGMIQSIADMRVYIEKNAEKHSSLFIRSRFVYQAGIALLDGKREDMKQLVEESEAMSELYQAIALKFQHDLDTFPQ